ncbi:MAG: 50S ribosomal protein L4 [Candidatus Saganbacteria bacterium]|nr:50S ribosomal protein L4 [Candidatus Saganbacteria bacterium]
MAKLAVYNLAGKEIEELTVSDKVFATSKSPMVVHQALVSYLANQRSGTASTKTRAEVSGGGVKPWKQKGTGRARVGSIRSPLWRGGGVVFGPKPRDYSFSLSKKMMKAALKTVLSDRVKEEAVKVVEELDIASGKTKDAVKALASFRKEGSKLLLVVHAPSENLKRAVKNIPFVKMVTGEGLNIHDLLSTDQALFTKQAVKALEERIEK